MEKKREFKGEGLNIRTLQDKEFTNVY